MFKSKHINWRVERHVMRNLQIAFMLLVNESTVTNVAFRKKHEFLIRKVRLPLGHSNSCGEID
jgi:hypothetical protein